MGLKIRLRKQGRTNRPFYRIVVADCRTKRDGKYIELVGWYNPLEAESDKNLSLDAERVQYWLEQGAMLTDKAEALVSRAAPEVVRKHTAHVQEQRVKMAAKKRERRKTSAA